MDVARAARLKMRQASDKKKNNIANGLVELRSSKRKLKKNDKMEMMEMI